VGILTFLPVEVDALVGAFEAALFDTDTTYFVDAQRRPTVVIRQSPSRSHMPSLGAASRLIEDFRPELLIAVGIAGGIEGRGKVFVKDKPTSVALGDVVVPEYLHYSEFIKLVSGDRLHRYFPYDQPSATIRDRFAKATQFRAKWQLQRTGSDQAACDPKVILDASLAAGEKLLGDESSDEQRKVVRFFTDAVAIDMESIAAARATYDARNAADYNPQLLIVRGISDYVRTSTRNPMRRLGGALAPLRKRIQKRGNTKEREEWAPVASRAAAAFTHDVVQAFLQTPDPRL
jgi:nucleoside phosphorylase